jgi:hypothetical protein
MVVTTQPIQPDTEDHQQNDTPTALGALQVDETKLKGHVTSTNKSASPTFVYVDLGVPGPFNRSESCERDTLKASATDFTGNPRPVTTATARSVYGMTRPTFEG